MHEFIYNNIEEWEESENVMFQIIFFVILYGTHLTFTNWFITILTFITCALVISWSGFILICGLFGVILAYVIRLRFCKTKFNWKRSTNINNYEYAIQLILIPLVLIYYVNLHVPQTSYPIGIILSSLLWGLFWLISYTIDFYDNGNLYYYVWLLPCIISFSLGFFFHRTLWISVCSSMLISLILIILPIKIPNKINKYL